MLISKTSRYALQATIYLAERWETGDAVQAWEIAQHTGVPKNYLSKILHQLARHGILSSERGPKGGFRLAMDPSSIRLAAVLEPVEGGLHDQHCLLGRASCSDVDPCLAHEKWRALSLELTRFLDETFLTDLAGSE